MEDQRDTTRGDLVFHSYNYSSQVQSPPSAAITATSTTTTTTTTITTNNGNKEAACGSMMGCISYLLVFVAAVYFGVGIITLGGMFLSPNFQIESVVIYPFNISSSSSSSSNSQITANWNVSFSFKNPREGPFLYENMEGSILLKNENVSSIKIGSFFLDGNKEKEKLVKIDLEAESVNMNQTVAEAVIAEKKDKGFVTLSFKLDCIGRDDPGGSNEKTRRMIVSCEDFMVRFDSDTEPAILMGGPILCNVHAHKI